MRIFKPKPNDYEGMKSHTRNGRIIKNNVVINKPSSADIDFSNSVDISDIPLNRLRVAYWSTWQVACGIAVYTEHLVKALQHHGSTIFVYSNKVTPQDLLKQVDIDRPHVLNIQYEPAIMPRTPELIALIRELRSRRIKVIMTFHSEPDSAKQLATVADQCIFHKPSNYFTMGGKINQIPMGVPVFNPSQSKETVRAKYGFTNEDKIMTTTGFMFTWKQHADVLMRMAGTLKENPHYKVQLLTAFNDVNPDECHRENTNIKSVIDTFELHNQVTHITSFLPQEELSERLWISDLGYLWSGITTSSSSAASKEFVTSRLPLVVTDSNHYHDMNVGVVRTPMDKDVFVNTILNTLSTSSLNNMRQELETTYDQLNYNNSILKHVEVFLK